ncbi:hypothetical protein BHE74_00057197 [Ensete ventricosum]|nr:hypothetical protein BHE74_00057197 [Ensete ventricosum]
MRVMYVYIYRKGGRGRRRDKGEEKNRDCSRPCGTHVRPDPILTRQHDRYPRWIPAQSLEVVVHMGDRKASCLHSIRWQVRKRVTA